jgi:hypothetical protein
MSIRLQIKSAVPEFAALHFVHQGTIADLQSGRSSAAIPTMPVEGIDDDLRLDLPGCRANPFAERGLF